MTLHEREEAVAALWRAGMTGPQIAHLLNVTPAVVHGDVRRLRARGIDLQARQWTRDTIVAAIRAWHDQHGRPPRSMEWKRRRAPSEIDRPTANTVISVFGTWRAGVEAAGFTTERRNRYGVHDLFAAFAAGRDTDVRDPRVRDDFERWLPSLPRAERRADPNPPQGSSTAQLRQQIAQLLAAGHTYGQIAARLEIAYSTAARHAASIKASS